MSSSKLLIFCAFLFATHSFAQTNTQASRSQPKFVSEVDEDLSIKRVAIAPFQDNMSGIYAKALDQAAADWLEKDGQWMKAAPVTGLPGLTRLEESPKEAAAWMKKAAASAILAGKVTKGPAGINIRLALFVGASGLPLLAEEQTEPAKFETDYIKGLTAQLIESMKQKLPYRGIIASRKGTEVTVNFGTNAGAKENQELPVIQILKINRHPRKKILVNAEKQIIGKIKIYKADENLSFGTILFEKEMDLLAPGHKVMSADQVKYPEPILTADGQLMHDLSNREDKDLAFGEKPVEWLPEPAPQYGKIQLLAGLGQYTATANLTSVGSKSGSSSFAPHVAFNAEGWLNEDWFFDFKFKQSSFSIENNYPNSSPSNLNVSTTKYMLSGGRNFLLGTDFAGPKLQLMLGFGKFASRIDESNPVLYSNMEYGGLLVSLNFSTPLADQSPWDLGARIHYYPSPNASTSVNSGAAGSTSVNDFAMTMGYHVRRNFRYIGELAFEYYNSDFTGSTTWPVSNVTHKSTTLMLGVEYLF